MSEKQERFEGIGGGDFLTGDDGVTVRFFSSGRGRVAKQSSRWRSYSMVSKRAL